MIIEISVAVAAGAFLLLAIFAVMGIMTSRKTLKEVSRTLHSAKKDLDELSVESLKLIKNLNDTTVDVKKKLHALDFVFKPLGEMGEKREDHKKSHDITSEIMECVAAGMLIYNKIKGAIKAYGKHG